MYDVSQIPDNLTTYAQVAEFLAESDWYVPEVDLEAIA